jgi:ubiquinone/menaquinone biosynthesis C-methylase UbiE
VGDWISYDSAAEAHERLRVPLLFAGPARDLLERMELGTAGSLLDVGTGSGVVARAASACPVVVGVDPSLGMVRVARQSGLDRVAVASAPGLPFADGSFDRVSAGFVLSHVGPYEEALRDMVRVLRPGGVAGATAWGELGNEYRDVWASVVERFVDRDELRAAAERALPWEGWLAEEGHLRDALARAGLREVTAERLEYPIPMTIAGFLEMRETSHAVRFLRARAGDDAWLRFQEAVANEFAARFRDPIDHTRTAWFAVGRKKGAMGRGPGAEG